MKSFSKLLIFGGICFALQACGGEEQSAADENVETNDTEAVSDSDESVNDEPEAVAPEPADDYHITLNKAGEEITTGPSKGKAMISDAFICTVGDWKMRILTDEFDPSKMVGNEYHAHIISGDFNSSNCKCQMNKMTGTGDYGYAGEYVKMEGDITCDDAESSGTFAVQLIDQTSRK